MPQAQGTAERRESASRQHECLWLTAVVHNNPLLQRFLISMLHPAPAAAAYGGAENWRQLAWITNEYDRDKTAKELALVKVSPTYTALPKPGFTICEILYTLMQLC
jgi:hypothetical protein